MNRKSQSLPTLSLLAKNSALLPTGIIFQELKNSAISQVPSASSSKSTSGYPRKKITLAPGHSLMDWIRLTSSGKDLTGIGEKCVSVTLAELAEHNKENDAWIAIRGIVFNVSLYMTFHPGGVTELMKGVGKDATKLFDNAHAWVNYQSILRKCIVGKLETAMSREFRAEKNIENPAKGNSENLIKTIFDLPVLKIKWQQTTNSISLFYTMTLGNSIDECEIKKINDAEFLLKIYCKSEDVMTYNIKFDRDVKWPPKCQRSCESSQDEILFKKKHKGIWKIYDVYFKSHEKKDLTKRLYNKYEVIENTLLCKIIHLLILRAKNYIQLIPPGRHVAVKINVMGTEVTRLYTPVPYCFNHEERPACVSGDDFICLIIKLYETGQMTPSLTALQPGQILELSNSLGNFRLEAYNECTTMHFLAAGTGLTTMLSIIKRTLSRHNVPTINIINFNTSEDNIFYAQQLNRISQEHKLTVTHILSAPDDNWHGRIGIISDKLLKDLIGKHSKKACIFTCGPRIFMKIAKKSLQNLGWDLSQMYEFDG